MTLSPYALLDAKRRGIELDPADIARFTSAFMRGDVADYQMSAFLMAIAIRGMSQHETAALTRAMLESGESWRLRERFDFVADKHSTGGVGDKISLPLSPLVAACGVKIAMLSGRGLGHTGGTLDKLETIPGFNPRLSREELERCVESAGCAISTSTAEIAPADRRMYALRDVTGTVESLPLITASIMSKKLAMGATALLLDVKSGSGAFMRSLEESRALARSLVGAAEGSGTAVEALITDMDAPLGAAAGNASEVAESFAILRGEGPPDATMLTKLQAVRILLLSGSFDEASAVRAVDEALSSGRAVGAAERWIEAQGGDPRVVTDDSLLPRPAATAEVRAPRSGWIESMDTKELGMIAVSLGAGRMRESDAVDPAAGIVFERKSGDAVTEGETIARLETGARPADTDSAARRFLAAIRIGDEPPPRRPLLHEIIRGETR
jgi:pyrimidine-nucleoside phosphorylase